MSLANYEEYGWAIGRGGLSISDPDDNGFRTGVYRHRLGLVEVDLGYGWTSIAVIRGGRSVRRRWPRELGLRTISRLCREMMEDSNVAG